MQQPIPVPEPSALVTAGVTTSEWLLVVRYGQQLAAAGTATVVAYITAKIGLHLAVPPEVLTAIVGLELSGAVAVVGYAISRGLAKMRVPTAQAVLAVGAATVPLTPSEPLVQRDPAPTPASSVVPPA